MNIAASPHNKHRVTIDVGQDRKNGPRVPRPAAGHGATAQGAPAGVAGLTRDWHPQGQTAAEAQRPGLLAQLGQLHRQGILTDSEFAAQKAPILGE